MSLAARMVNWQTPRGVARAAGVAIVLQALLLGFFIAGTHGWITKVPPLTTDYASFYAAGALANEGRPAAAYDHDQHLRAEEAATAPGVAYQYFFNPPTYLLIMAPFARLPYLASFLAVQGLTLGLWLWLGTWVAGGGRVATLALLAVPSVWWVLGLGQNSFLSASLLAAATLCLPARPWLAGIAFGALCYKPHLALMVPVALLAAGQWRTIVAAGLTLGAAAGASVALYGVETWRAFLAMARGSVAGPIDSGRVLFAGRVDITGAAQMIGLTPHAARLVWIMCLLPAVWAVVWLWRRGSRETRSAGLVASVFFGAPFLLMYDLVTASLAVAWLVRAARQTGFLAGERLAFILLFLLSLAAAHPVVAATHIPFGAFAGPAILALAVRRARCEGLEGRVARGVRQGASQNKISLSHKLSLHD